MTAEWQNHGLNNPYEDTSDLESEAIELAEEEVEQAQTKRRLTKKPRIVIIGVLFSM
jgi:hypothetical protein